MSIEELLDQIEQIKTKITDQEYKQMLETLSKLKKTNESNFFKVHLIFMVDRNHEQNKDHEFEFGEVEFITRINEDRLKRLMTCTPGFNKFFTQYLDMDEPFLDFTIHGDYENYEIVETFRDRISGTPFKIKINPVVL
jgi:hypothetical protein